MARPSRMNRVLFAQEQNSEALMALPNVIGVATGNRMRNGRYTDEICVQVFVTSKLPSKDLSGWERVPQAVLGIDDEQVRTDVVQISLPQAQQDNTRYRPVPGGCSIGPEMSNSAGTLGGWACDQSDDTIVLLSNNHVISNLDTQPAQRRIVQPGRLDGGVLPNDVIGTLKRDIQLQTIANAPTPPTPPTPPVTQVDAAIGTITVDRTDNVLQTGPGIYELQAPTVGMNVQKRGRTTRLTTNGSIASVNGTFNVTYRNRTRLGRVANTFVINSTDGNVFSMAGDSGSLIFNQQQGQLNGTLPVIGLLYAGGTYNNGLPYTLACDINAVFGALNLGTVCGCVVRAIMRVFAEQQATGAEASERFVRDKEGQLRRLRDRVLPKTRLGKAVTDLIAAEAAEIGRVLIEDEESFELAVRAAEPWLRKRTNREILDSRIEAGAVRDLVRLANRLARRIPRLKAQLGALREIAEKSQDRTVREVLRTTRRSLTARR